MGCPCQSSGGVLSTSIPAQNYTAPVIRTDCGLDRDVLKTWMTALLCIKLQDKLEKAKLNLATVNQVIGTVQSALNYPDNYCYFYDMLEFFKDNILPQIVINVPECFS